MPVARTPDKVPQNSTACDDAVVAYTNPPFGAIRSAGTVTVKQVREIAEAKMKDLSANDVEAAMQIILGSARSIGIEVKG